MLKKLKKGVYVLLRFILIFLLIFGTTFTKEILSHKDIVNIVLGHEGEEIFKTEREFSKYGIRKKTLKEYNKKYNTSYEVEKLKRDDAVKISINLLKEYRVNEINSDKLKLVIYDTIFNAGYTGGSKITQRALNQYVKDSIPIDGVMGSKTINEINKIKDEKRFIEIFTKERFSYYKGIKDWETYKESWSKRIAYFAKLK